MSFVCSHCGEEISPFDLYCPFCGAEAPRRTLPPNVKEEEITEGIYCPSCGQMNHKKALFCGGCGWNLYKRPEIPTMICPHCGESNSKEARFCSSCKSDLGQWFSSYGAILEKLGFRGSFTLYETMAEKFYHFIQKDIFTIGRNRGNDLVLPCPWVSGNHCKIMVKERKLVDHNSTNGTYVNRSPQRINEIILTAVREMNVAGAFTFQVKIFQGLVTLQLTALVERKELEKVTPMDEIDALRKHIFIFVAGDGEIKIRKFDGVVLGPDDEKKEYFKVKVHKGGYYLTDEDRGIKEKLLLQRYNNLPKNWEIELKE